MRVLTGFCRRRGFDSGIPEAELERLKHEVSVEHLAVARGIALRPSGNNLMGMCPFHDDHEPSQDYECVYDGSGNLLPNRGTFHYGPFPLSPQHLWKDVLPSFWCILFYLRVVCVFGTAARRLSHFGGAELADIRTARLRPSYLIGEEVLIFGNDSGRCRFPSRMDVRC